MPVQEDNEIVLDGRLVGQVERIDDGFQLEGAHVIVVAEDESYSAEAYTDENGEL